MAWRLSVSLLVACALFGACTPAASEELCASPQSAASPPGDAGPFQVGYRTFQTSYTPPGQAARTLTINVWYPTSDPGGQSARYLGIYNDDAAFVEASLAPPLSGCRYPVLVYSHGFAAFGGSAAYQARHFASHGWVVLAPDHTLNTFLDKVRPPDWIHYARGLDIAATLDAADALEASDPLAGKLDLSRVVMSGHSFGAFTTWSVAGAAFDVAALRSRCERGDSDEASCSEAAFAAYARGVRDPRVVAAIPLAGAPDDDWFGLTGPDAIRIPMMELTGSNDQRGVDAVFARSEGFPFTWIEFAGGCHETFAMGINCDTFDVPEGYRLARTYAMAFARKHLLGDATTEVTSIVDGTQSLSPLVTFRSK